MYVLNKARFKKLTHPMRQHCIGTLCRVQLGLTIHTVLDANFELYNKLLYWFQIKSSIKSLDS